jgi:hypothetical protein
VESTTGALERRKSGKNSDFVHVGGIDLGPLKSGIRIQVTGMLGDWGRGQMVMGAWAYSDTMGLRWIVLPRTLE